MQRRTCPAGGRRGPQTHRGEIHFFYLCVVGTETHQFPKHVQFDFLFPMQKKKKRLIEVFFLFLFSFLKSIVSRLFSVFQCQSLRVCRNRSQLTLNSLAEATLNRSRGPGKKPTAEKYPTACLCVWRPGASCMYRAWTKHWKHLAICSTPLKY